MKRMNIAIILSILFLVGAVASTLADEESDKATRGTLKDEVVSNAASHFIFLGGDGRNAGTIVSSKGEIEGLDKVTVKASSSWDWALFTNSENGDVEERHPCALVNTTPHTFLGGTASGGVFTTDATVTITTKKGDKIFANVTGGSVCEIKVDTSVSPPCTTNEGVATFEIVDGTGKFSSASGNGLLHTIFDFCNGVFVLDEISLHMNELDD